MTRAHPLGLSRRVSRASTAFAVVVGVVMSLGVLPARAGLPLTFDHMTGRPRHVSPESVAVDGGNVYVTETGANDRIVKYDADGTFKDVIAGPGTAAGYVDNPTSIAVSPTGGHNLYVAEAGATARVSYFSQTGNYLGTWGTSGSGNGSFNSPQGIAVDQSGNVYVADTSNGRIQKFTSAGAWIETWDSSNGVTNPLEVAIDAGDKVWVANGSTVAKYSTSGTQLTSWTATGATGIDVDQDGDLWVTSSSGVVRQYSPSGTVLATLGSGQLSSPQGVAVSASEVFVADTGNHRIARYGFPSTPASWSAPGVTGVGIDGSTVYTADGTDVRPFDTSGNAGTSWASNGSHSVAPDGSGNVWVSSSADGVVREYDASGNLLITIGSGSLSGPRGVAFAGGKVYVADTGNDRIVRFSTSGTLETSWASTGVTGLSVSGSTVYAVAGNTVRTSNTLGGSSTTWTTSNGATDIFVDGSGNVWVSSTDDVVREYTSGKALIATLGSGSLTNPVGLAFSSSHLYVADTGNDRVVKFSFSSLETTWGEYPDAGVEDSPSGIAVDASNNVYVTNAAQDLIQKFDEDGNFLLEWGSGGNAAGELSGAQALAISPANGDLYVADTGNDRIQRFTTAGAFVSQWGSNGSNAALQQMISPSGIDIDASGNVYVADIGNGRIDKFGPTGTYLATFGAYGTGGGNGQLYEPRGVLVDGSGNVWVADSRHNRIQEWAPDGTFLAQWGGSGTQGISSSSADGKLYRPYDLAMDAEGTLWVADRNNYRIQRVDTSGGFLSKLGSQGLDIDQFKTPGGIAVDSAGRVLVADTGNDRVQVFIDANGPDTTFTGGPGTITKSTSASFTYTANEPGATFLCTADGGGSGPWSACSSGDSFTGFSEGAHTMYVKAVDTDGNEGDPATYDWTVDLTPPSATIDTQPSSPTSSTSAAFTYHASEAGGSYLCSLDGSTPAACSASYSNTVANGDHTFDVWAIDQAGNQSLAPAEYTWTVDTTPPVVHIDGGPSGTVLVTDATFTFSADEGGVTFQCALDGLVFAPCTTGITYSPLTGGAHTFSLKGFDALQNPTAIKTRTWIVDLATHRPDGLVGVGGKYAGNDVYNATATNQSKTIKTRAGTTVSFTLRFENDGTDTDSYTIKGGGSAKGYTVTYYSGSTDFTTKVTGGTCVFSLAAGASKTITMRVRVGSKGLSSWSSLVKVTSGHDPTKVDAVKGVVKRT